MKLLSFFLAILAILNFACTKKVIAYKGTGYEMQMDSTYADDKNVTVLHAKDTIRISESMKRFEDNPNITQTDIDAGKGIESKEVQYVKKGDTLRITEQELNRK